MYTDVEGVQRTVLAAPWSEPVLRSPASTRRVRCAAAAMPGRSTAVERIFTEGKTAACLPGSTPICATRRQTAAMPRLHSSRHVAHGTIQGPETETSNDRVRCVEGAKHCCVAMMHPIGPSYPCRRPASPDAAGPRATVGGAIGVGRAPRALLWVTGALGLVVQSESGHHLVALRL